VCGGPRCEDSLAPPPLKVQLGVAPAAGWHFVSATLNGEAVTTTEYREGIELEDHPVRNEIVVTFEPDPAPSGCGVPPETGPTEPVMHGCLGRTFGDAGDAETILCDREYDDDIVRLELHDGPADVDPAPGRYDLATSYAECTTCVVLFLDQSGTPPIPAAGDAYVAVSGTVVVEEGERDGHIRAHLEDVTLEHVFINPDFSTTPAGDGCTTHLDWMLFDADLDLVAGKPARGI
jgi:hypothetical protein